MPKGKKQKLNAARKEIMEEISKEIDNVERESDTEDHLEENLTDERETYCQLDTFIEIQRNLASYVKDHDLPLCEYLNVDDIENFINTVFSSS